MRFTPVSLCNFVQKGTLSRQPPRSCFPIESHSLQFSKVKRTGTPLSPFLFELCFLFSLSSLHFTSLSLDSHSTHHQHNESTSQHRNQLVRGGEGNDSTQWTRSTHYRQRLCQRSRSPSYSRVLKEDHVCCSPFSNSSRSHRRRPPFFHFADSLDDHSRKVDIRLLIILSAIYAVSLIDRTNISVARVAGMARDLQLTVGERYSIITLVFFAPYVRYKIPTVIRPVQSANWPRQNPNRLSSNYLPTCSFARSDLVFSFPLSPSSGERSCWEWLSSLIGLIWSHAVFSSVSSNLVSLTVGSSSVFRTN